MGPNGDPARWATVSRRQLAPDTGGVARARPSARSSRRATGTAACRDGPCAVEDDPDELAGDELAEPEDEDDPGEDEDEDEDEDDEDPHADRPAAPRATTTATIARDLTRITARPPDTRAGNHTSSRP